MMSRDIDYIFYKKSISGMTPVPVKRYVESIPRKFICAECNTSYQHNNALLQHLKKYHSSKSQTSVSVPSETGITKKSLKSIPEKFNNSTNSKYYQNGKLLKQQYLRKSCIKCPTSDSIPVEKGTVNRCAESTSGKVTCSECNKSCQQNCELKQHIRESNLTKSRISMSVLTRTETAERCTEFKPGKFICSECDKSYQNNYELQQHMKELHLAKSHISVSVPSKIETAEKCSEFTPGEFVCSECDKSYQHNRTLKQHMKKFHPLKFPTSYVHEVAKKVKNYKRTVFCSLCQQNVNKKSYDLHCKTAHNVTIETEELHFPSFDDFTYWKENLENATHATFVKNRGEKPDKYGIIKVSLQCHRSGYYINKGEGQRHLKKLGSCKINGYCPAGIQLSKAPDNDECHIIFTKTHVGHENEIKHQQLSLYERQLIASKLASKVSPDAILDEIRDSVSGSQLERIHLLTRKDLHNIKQSFKINVPTIHHLSKKRKNDERLHHECNEESSDIDTPETVLCEMATEVDVQNSQLVEKKVKIKEKLERLVDDAESVKDIETLEKLVALIHPTLKAVRANSHGKSPLLQVLMSFPQ